jgi:hypothetical protein
MLSREQLQKVLQHFVEVVPVSCIASLQNIVSQVKDRESEISKQPGAPDFTSGGYADEPPCWQMESSTLNKYLEDLFSHYERLDVQHEPSFNSDLSRIPLAKNFLRHHDANIVSLFVWVHAKFSTVLVQVHGHSRWKKSPSHATSTATEQFCKLLIPLLEVFFVDPHFSQSLKSEVKTMIAEIIESNDLCRALHVTLAVLEEGATPTVEYFKQGLKGFQVCSGTDGETHGCVLMSGKFHCLLAVVRYWSLHRKVHGDAMQEAVLELCGTIFPLPLSAVGVGDLNCTTHPTLREMGPKECVEQCLFLLSCLTAPQNGSKQYAIVQFALNLLTYATKDLTPLSTGKDLTAIQHLQKTVLNAVKPLMGSLLYQEVRDMLMSTLECFLQETTWEERRWCALSVVKLALLTADKAVTQAANTVMQFAIGNPHLLLSQETIFASKTKRLELLNTVGVVAAEVLMMLFKSLPQESSLELFACLNAAFPDPCDYLASLTLLRGDELSPQGQKLLEAALPAIDDLSVDRTIFSHCIFPNLQNEDAKNWLLRKADVGSESELNETDTRILRIGTTFLSVSSHHRRLMDVFESNDRTSKSRNLECNREGLSFLLQFQLHLLHMSVCHCENLQWGQFTSMPQVREQDCSPFLFCRIPQSQQAKALEYLHSKWSYCLCPQTVLELFVGSHRPEIVPGGVAVASTIILEALRTAADPRLKSKQCIYESVTKAIDFVADGGNVECFTAIVDLLLNSKAEFVSVKKRNKTLLANEQHKLLFSLASAAVKLYNLVRQIGNLTSQHLLQDRWSQLLSKLMLTSAVSSFAIYNLGKCGSYWAAIACDAGKVQEYFDFVVASYGSVVKPSFWQNVTQLWREYCRTAKDENRSILSTPPFSKMVPPVLERMRTESREIAKKWWRDADMMSDTLLDLARVYKLLGLGAESFHELAQNLASVCSVTIRPTIVEQFVTVTLSDIDTS